MTEESQASSDGFMAGNGKTVVFRADGGPGIGGGHIARCLSLARTLTDSGFSCAFALSPESASVVPTRLRSDFTWAEVACPPEQEAEVLRRIWPHGCDLLVVDHYGRNAGFESSCRGWASRILVIDDLADRKHDCDYLLDASPGASRNDYLDLVPPGCRLLVGPDYALLRPEFMRFRGQSVARRAQQRGLKRVFACFGALDDRRLLPEVMDVVCGLDDALEMDVAVRRGVPHLDQIRQGAAQHGQRVQVHIDASNIAELMARADLGIGAAGGVALEGCCVGLPSVLFTTAANQQRNALALEAAGAALRLQLDGLRPFQRALKDEIRLLVKHPGKLSVMSEKATKICDGRGALRLLLEITSSRIPIQGKEIRLRLARNSDTTTIYNWQKHPITRKHFRNPLIPSWNEHVEWMKNVLSDPDRMLFVIEAENNPVGTLRLDTKRQQNGMEFFEISIMTAPKLHGRGIAKTAVLKALKLFPGKAFLAEVLPGNIVSQALFHSIGFNLIDENTFLLLGEDN